ncbi:MAG: endonuclease V, partial [Candidatus Pacearchaeota archaeon]
MERDELINKYHIDIKKLETEQTSLAKQLEIKDKIDFSLADRFGAIETIFIKNKILCCIIVCSKPLEKEDGKIECEVLDRVYFFGKTSFPYLAGFRDYRELPAMLGAFDKLTERPDVVFIQGEGLTHPRLGLASHFSLSVGVPAIGVSNNIINCKVQGEDIFFEGKKVGKVLITKPQSKPMYISPGNLISLNSSYELCKKFINLPHKFPEPLHLAGKYCREVKEE